MSRSDSTACMMVLVLILSAASAAWAAPDMLPAAVGNKWEYETVKYVRAELAVDGRPLAVIGDASSGASVHEFVSVDDKAPTLFEYVETRDMQVAGGGRSETEKSEIKLASDADALRILSSVGTDSRDEEPDRQTYDPPLLYFHKNAAPGKAWDVGSMRDGDVESPTSARIAGKETVTVPAGTFKDCTKVIYSSDKFIGTIEIMKKDFSLTSGRSRGIYWIADGVGIVKELEVSTSVAEAEAGNGKTIKMNAAVCTVSELKPGYTVKGSKVNGQSSVNKD